MIENKKKSIISKLFVNLIFILLSLCCVIPLLYILAASFTSELSLQLNGYKLIPDEISFGAYEFIFKFPEQILNAYGVTIITTVVGTVISLLCTSTLAYVISRRDFKLRNIFSFMATFTLLFNGGMVASYIINTQWYHLSDKIWAMILPYVILPWHVFLMRSFFNDTPMELIDAAKVDGATEFFIFFKIVAPISKPAFATVGLFTAFTYWNDWWLSMLYINEDKLTSLQYYLYQIMNSIEFLKTGAMASLRVDFSKLPSETARMALCIVAIGPMMLVFPFFQKYFVKGITVGSVKG